MRHGDEGAAAHREVVGEPRDRLDVEVVGGLVEHEEVGVVDDEARERSAAPFAAGHGADDGVETRGVAGRVDPAEQPVHDVADPRLAGPLVVGAVAHDDVRSVAVGVEVVGLRQQARP